ncbi:MAG: metal-dependent hydrolase [Salinisphaeraceae bacterium]|jgi:ABC-2 type transport system permease protein|nr:metal-dependent hydrolase [Salinisphaeraceae bacterium]
MTYGCYTLFRKEVRRFYSVLGQTVAAPVITAMLYLLVFRQVLEDRVQVYDGVSYTAFLIPGLIMMSIIQNSFANTSSSLTQSKVMGNLVFLLMTPLSALEIYLAYVSAALLRAALVSTALYLFAQFFITVPIVNPLLILAMLLFSGGTLAVLGMIAGIVADKFEHLAAFQNFFIMPLSFLSGVFYSIHSLPEFWRQASHYNPFFYMIDGFRQGFFGVGDTTPLLCVSVAAGFFALISALCIALLHSGYKLRT